MVLSVEQLLVQLR